MTDNAHDIAAMTRAGLNLIKQALSIYDSDLKLVHCNRPFRDMFDLPREFTEPGADFAQTIRLLVMRGEYGEDVDIDEAVAFRVEQAQAFLPHYVERQRANGRWISIEGSPLPEGGWVTVYTDITQTRAQEELLRARSEELSDRMLSYAEELAATNRALQASVTALEEAKDQLASSEAHTRQTTEMIPAHIAHVDRNGRYTFSNRNLPSVMPGRQANIVGRRIRDVLGKEVFAKIGPHLEKAQNGEPSAFEFFDEASSRRIRTAFTPANSPGERQGVYILSTDITRETQARTALQQTRRRELAAQLTSGMAHDFSNLLTIILGSQARLQKLDLPPEALKPVNATLAATHRGGALLNRLADITGAREWNPEPADIDLLLQDLRILATPALPANITLNVNNLLKEKRLLLDTGMVQNSLLNLILNARDACGTSGEISVTIAPVQNLWAEFIVDDTGPGFSKSALDRALEPFYTTKGGEGSGLGLSMVYDMTKLAGGRTRVSNTETGGRVILRLPLHPAPAAPAPGLVMLVEDGDDLRALVRDMLTEQGNTVIEATSVNEALALLEQLPQVTRILSDISLEGEKTGIDLINALPQTAPPISLMTSLALDHPLHMAAADVVPVLRKPFTQSQLFAFLQKEPTSK